MKKNLYVGLLFLLIITNSTIVNANPGDHNIDEDVTSTRKRVNHMVAFCRQKCSLKDDLLERCTRTCIKDYSQ